MTGFGIHPLIHLQIVQDVYREHPGAGGQSLAGIVSAAIEGRPYVYLICYKGRRVVH